MCSVQKHFHKLLLRIYLCGIMQSCFNVLEQMIHKMIMSIGLDDGVCKVGVCVGGGERERERERARKRKRERERERERERVLKKHFFYQVTRIFKKQTRNQQTFKIKIIQDHKNFTTSSKTRERKQHRQNETRMSGISCFVSCA